MKISQKNLTRIIVLIGAAIYNFVLFLVLAGREKNAVFWIAYGFVMLIPLLILAFTFIKIPFPSGTRLALSLPLVRILIAYCVVDFAAATVIMILSRSISVRMALIVLVVVLAVFEVLFIVFYKGVRHIGEGFNKQRESVLQQNMLVAKLNSIANSTDDAKVAAKIRQIAEEVRYGDYNVYPQLKELDARIEATADGIADALSPEEMLNAATKLERLVAERKEKLLYIKKLRG